MAPDSRQCCAFLISFEPRLYFALVSGRHEAGDTWTVDRPLKDIQTAAGERACVRAVPSPPPLQYKRVLEYVCRYGIR